MSFRVGHAAIRARSLIVIGLTVAVAMATVSVAEAVVQGGRRTPSASYYDGTGANIAGNSFSPDSNHCLIYSVLVYDETDPHQLEVGLVRCNSFSVDGNCDDVKFVEQYDGSVYTCHPHGSFSNDTHYYFNVKRDSNTSGHFSSHLGASQTEYEGQGGFNTSDNLRLYAWGERNGAGTSCSGWSGTGDFEGWQKFSYASSWDYLHGSIFNGGATCWNVSSINDFGDFSVSN